VTAKVIIMHLRIIGRVTGKARELIMEASGMEKIHEML
jgi:hypothetical protein